MADGDRGSPGKRSPTIDLKATEVPTPPAESAAAPDAPEEPAKPAEPVEAAEQAATPAADAPAPDTAATAWRFEPSTDAADGAPPEEPPAAPPPSRPEPSRLPAYLAAGATGAAVSLAALLALWGAGLFERPDDGAARIASLEDRLREIAARPAPAAPNNTAALDQLAARLARLESAPAAAPPAGNGIAPERLAGVEASAKAAADKVAALERQLQELTTATGEARRRADAAAAQASQSTTATDTAAERREIEALAGRVAAVEGAVKQLNDDAARRAAEGAVDRGVRRALATIALRNAVERGTPFAAELAAAKPFVGAPEALAPLEPFAASGLPSARAVGAELTGVASAMVRAADTGAREGGFLDRLQANAERLVRVRPVGDTPGDDAPAIIARAEARAKEGDLAAALAELRKLPEPVRAPAAAWIKKAEAHLAAVDASRKLSADAVGALGRS